METKKELTVGDFLNLSMIYNVVDFQISILSEGLIGDFADDIKQDLQDIYELVVSAVTLKDGTIPKYWDKSISNCHIAMSYKDVQQISNKLENFREKGIQRFYLYDDLENEIVENLSDVNIEIALENLLIGLSE